SDPQATPNQQLNPQATPDSQTNGELEAMMKLQAFAKKLAEQGFKDVEIVPQAVLVSAKDKSDKPVLMIFDTQTMVAVQLQMPQSETTGSGSSGDTGSGMTGDDKDGSAGGGSAGSTKPDR